MRTWPARYGLAVLLVSSSLAITMALEQLVRNAISPLFFLAIMFSAWYGGLGPALVATGLSTFACAYFFLDPKDSLLIGFDDVMRLAVFTVSAVLTSSLTALRRRAETGLQQARDELDGRVRERTAELRAVNQSLQQQIDHARRVETALRQAEERFRLVIEGVSDHAIFMLDPDGRVVSWNPGAARISGWSEEEIAGRKYDCFFPPDATGRRDDAARGLAAAAAGERLAAEGWRVRKDGSLFWAEETVTALRSDDPSGGSGNVDGSRSGGTGGALRGFAVVMRDVTERKRLEQSVLEVSERERRRIGHDLHDGLGQQLTGLALRSKMLEHNLAATSPADAAEARRVAELINQTIRQARDLAHGLAPVEQDAEGLCGALRQLAVQAQELFGIRCRVDLDDRAAATAFADGDDAAATCGHVYRIVQEAINNAVKHGNAREVVIRLTGGSGHGVLSVSDDGAGFDPAHAPRGMGLDLMSYRARMIGGALDVVSRPGDTRVTCAWSRPSATTQSAATTAPRESADRADVRESEGGDQV